MTHFVTFTSALSLTGLSFCFFFDLDSATCIYSLRSRFPLFLSRAHVVRHIVAVLEPVVAYMGILDACRVLVSIDSLATGGQHRGCCGTPTATTSVTHAGAVDATL